MARFSDRKLVLWIAGSAVAFIIAVSVLLPKHSEDNPLPRVDNNGTGGAKAAFLLLPKLGYKVERWNAPEEQLDKVDATRTTLIMADLYVEPTQQKAMTAAMQRFLDRGGRVLETGDGTVLPLGTTVTGSSPNKQLCYTTPQGQGPLARVGQLTMTDFGAWNEKESKLGAALHVDQRCGEDAVVVSYKLGKGEAIWWSSSMPLSNRGLREDNNLKLLLATIGEPGRTVLFDEFSHGAKTGLWDPAEGLPIRSLGWQLALIAALLVFSFSRRSGPLRAPVIVPRTSPIEFAESMGHLYERAGATNAATGMARRRLLRFLETECGVSHVAIEAGPDVIAETLEARMGGDWSLLRQHLQDAAQAERTELAAKSALRMVQALNDDRERLEALLAPKRLAAAQSQERIAEDTEERGALLASSNKE